MKQKWYIPATSIPLLQYGLKDSMWLRVNVCHFKQITKIASHVSCLKHYEDQMWDVLCKCLGQVRVYFSLHVTVEMHGVQATSSRPLIKATHFYYYNSFNFRNKHLNLMNPLRRAERIMLCPHLSNAAIIFSQVYLSFQNRLKAGKIMKMPPSCSLKQHVRMRKSL